ncbi:MAG: alpha/beta fold hydrolase [Actinomycetes bacterium]
MSDIPNSESFYLSGGKIGILMIHGFTGSPASILPWAKGLNRAGFTVAGPRLAGHGTRWEDLNQSTWEHWYESVELAFLELKKSCERVFIAGFSVGGALALRLAQVRGAEIEGLILLNPSIYDDRKFYHLLPVLQHFIPSIAGGPSDISIPNPPRHGYGRIPLRALNSLRSLWKVVERDLYLVDTPLMIAYSINDHVVHPSNSETVIDNVYSVDIREVIFEKSFHNVALDVEAEALIEESVDFLQDVLSGELAREGDNDERELIDAEFSAIVSGLSLDTSSPTTYLDELDEIESAEAFKPPNPTIPPPDQVQRAGLICLIGGSLYLFVHLVFKIDFFGLGPWPGILGFLGGIAIYIWRTARPEDEFDDGAIV